MPMEIKNPKNLTFTKDSLIKYQFIAKGGVSPYEFKTPSNLPAGWILYIGPLPLPTITAGTCS